MEFEYVEMKYDLERGKEIVIPSHVKIRKVNHEDIELLRAVYTTTFEKGDAKFYRCQSEEEKFNYFNEGLGLPEVIEQPESLIMESDEKIIGFLFALQYGEKNVHISCMCLDPNYQSRGYGKLMLDDVVHESIVRGMATLSLGTESTMTAFNLYEKYGFVVTERQMITL